MTDNPLFLGAVVGVAASAAFLYVEIGRYAAPQVPRSLFDERKLLFAFTAGLFVGVVVFLLVLLLMASLAIGGVVGGAAIFLGLILVVIEVGQFLLGRSVYFGHEAAVPFYVLSYRAGIAALVVIGLVADYFAGPSLTLAGAAGAIATAPALVLLLEASGIQSTPTGAGETRRSGSLGRGVLLELFGFLLIGIGAFGGPAGPLIAALAVAGGSAGLYLRRRDEVLGNVRPPRSPEEDEAPPPGRFARRERKGSD